MQVHPGQAKSLCPGCPAANHVVNPALAEDIRNRLLLARLPAMPQVLLRLLALCQDDEAGMAELAQLLGQDAAITTRVMRVANSAAYQRSGHKVSLLQAAGVLGSELIKTLAISESVQQTFSHFSHSTSADMRSFWRHSLTTAVLARGLAQAMRYPHSEEAYLAGLLHDVGRLALLAVAPEAYLPLFSSSQGDALLSAEQRVLNMSHTEAGAWLIERWQMDSFLADAVLYHHESPERVEGAHALVRLLHLAERLSSLPHGQPVPDGLGQLCQLGPNELQALLQTAAQQVQQAADFLGIDISLPAVPAPSGSLASVPPEQQRLTEEVRRRALLGEMAQAFAAQKDDTRLLNCINNNARLLFELEDSAVFLLGSDRQELLGVAVSERQQRLAGFSITLKGGLMTEAVVQRRLVFLERSQGLPSVAESQLLRAWDTPCLLCLPLLEGGRCLGLLVGPLPTWRVPELRAQEQMLMAYGTQAARALQAAVRERGEMDRRIASVREEHLLQSRKVVHEANKPLAIIKNYLGVLDDKLARAQPVDGELSVLNEEIDRVGNIIREFAGTAPAQPEAVVDVNRVVNDIVRLFRESRFLPASVQIVAHVPADSSDILGSADTLKQVLVNLIKNAVEALVRGGRIDVSNLGRVQHQGQVFFKLQVADDGPGIAPDVMQRLFSPVRSSKPGDNRGLGLSIVQGLVQKLGGQIRCESTAQGTRFDILLPARSQRPETAALP